MKIIQIGDPRLEKKSNKVESIRSSKTQKLIDNMLTTVNQNADHTAGLSAPQVGELQNIFLINRFDIVDENDPEAKPIWEVMINPEIIWRNDEEFTTFWEGCLSIKEGDLFGEVERAADVEVKYFDREGKEKKLKASDFFSHVIQHEMDHLEGVLFLKYVKDPTKLYSGKDLDRMVAEGKID